MARTFPPSGHTARASRIGFAAVLTAVLVVSAVVGTSTAASADDPHSHHLHSQKAQFDGAISQTQVDLTETSAQLVSAQQRLDVGLAALDTAKAHLVSVQLEVVQAAARDHEMQRRLDLAVSRLQDAQHELTAGQHQLSVQRAALASYAISSYQSGGPSAISIDVAFNSVSPQELFSGMQASSTALDKQSQALQELQARQVLLRLTEKRVVHAQEQVAADRTSAAQNLADMRDLQGQAEVAQQDVTQRVASLQSAQRQVAAAKAVELARIATLQQERSQVETQLRAIAIEQARQRRLAMVKAARSAASADGNTQLPSTSGGAPLASVGSSPTQALSSSTGFLSYPVANAYITSPYGMRLHPILHVWKLHDGTDFAAACGTPVYAAADGTVLSEYFNAGYGNRIIINHGIVEGVSLATSYNHLTSFVARAGEHVSRGQLIAYSGTTGYSTGCHLHFMVYVNGTTVDPMAHWL
ncbi:MAG: peptidoglycan DD-metalloendopeptidase family protein [Nocardioidaceae bacterium]